MRGFRLCDSRLSVVVVVLGVGYGRGRCQPLWAAHGPAERAALRTCRAHRAHAHRTPPAPASHHRTKRRRLRDCRLSPPNFFFYNL